MEPEPKKVKVGVKRTFSDLKQSVDRNDLVGIDLGMNVKSESRSDSASRDLKVLRKAPFQTDYINPTIKR